MAGADEGALYERASDLHRRGRPEEAIPLLQELLQEAPDDLAARYAYGICLTDTGRHAEAQVQFRRVLDGDQRHYQATYRLGRLLQADGDAEGAAEAYLRVLRAAEQALGVAEFRDTATRLKACRDALGATVPVPSRSPEGRPVTGRPITPGPPTLRAQSESHRVAERGVLKVQVRLKARHLLSLLAKRFLIAVALTAAGIFLAEQGIGVGVRSFNVLPGLLALVYFLCSFVLLLVKPRTNGADFYEYGVDVKSLSCIPACPRPPRWAGCTRPTGRTTRPGRALDREQGGCSGRVVAGGVGRVVVFIAGAHGWDGRARSAPAASVFSWLSWGAVGRAAAAAVTRRRSAAPAASTHFPGRRRCQGAQATV
ncbi:tetratricopeptide repeat protein [Streptomyces sp. NPDC057686]|uniref:tetratricopeptide repeat protein n=1 Tax=Streptomyces sp. NPDC057686 TaxID=3346212 RepID=UPI003685A7E0